MPQPPRPARPLRSSARPRLSSGTPKPTPRRRRWLRSWPLLRPAPARREAGRAAAEADRDAAIGQARAEAATRVAAAETDRDADVARTRAEASQQISAAEADRDQARQTAAQAEQDARAAQQEAARALAAAGAARAETGRVRADAEKMLADLRADAVRDRDELRADLRTRAERAEQQADAYRDELAQLRAESSHPAYPTIASKTPRRAVQAAGWPTSEPSRVRLAARQAASARAVSIMSAKTSGFVTHPR